MDQFDDPLSIDVEARLGDQSWSEVLQAVDRTYAELVDYQEQLEQRNAELTNLRHFLSSIMTSISDYLVVTDRDGRIMDACVSFRDALGMELDELETLRVCRFFEGESCDQIMRAIGQVLTTRSDLTINVSMKTVQGIEPVEFRISPQLDRRRKPTGAVLTGRPMGELLRAYAKLETSHSELKDAQTQLVRTEKMASLGRLLAGVAHELNNPISFVYANTHTLDKYLTHFETYFEEVQGGATRDQLVALRNDLKLDRNLANFRSAVQGAQEGAERVRDIVEDLRRLSADGSGEITQFDFVEVARIAAHWIERGSKTKLDIHFAGLPVCLVSGRPGHIQQVLMNLVQNSVDALAGKMAPVIGLNFYYEGPNAIFEMCDNGPGIPDEMAASIFDPFFTTKEVGKGTGLGLAISFKIIEEHGGTLELVKRVHSGACFRITLPRGDQG